MRIFFSVLFCVKKLFWREREREGGEGRELGMVEHWSVLRRKNAVWCAANIAGECAKSGRVTPLSQVSGTTHKKWRTKKKKDQKKNGEN